MKCKLIDDKNDKIYEVIHYHSRVCTIRDESGKEYQIPTVYVVMI